MPERATQVQLAAVETVWGIGALPAPEDREARVHSAAVPVPAEAARVQAARVAPRACAVEGAAGGVAAGADEGK
jgi:hypothetical protein